MASDEITKDMVEQAIRAYYGVLPYPYYKTRLITAERKRAMRDALEVAFEMRREASNAS